MHDLDKHERSPVRKSKRERGAHVSGERACACAFIYEYVEYAFAASKCGHRHIVFGACTEGHDKNKRYIVLAMCACVSACVGMLLDATYILYSVIWLYGYSKTGGARLHRATDIKQCAGQTQSQAAGCAAPGTRLLERRTVVGGDTVADVSLCVCAPNCCRQAWEFSH